MEIEQEISTIKSRIKELEEHKIKQDLKNEYSDLNNKKLEDTLETFTEAVCKLNILMSEMQLKVNTLTEHKNDSKDSVKQICMWFLFAFLGWLINAKG